MLIMCITYKQNALPSITSLRQVTMYKYFIFVYIPTLFFPVQYSPPIFLLLHSFACSTHVAVDFEKFSKMYFSLLSFVILFTIHQLE